MLQSALAAQMPNACHPAQVLSGLNQAFWGKFQSQYVTASCLFVDLSKGAVSYAGAAHPPLLLWQSKTGRSAEYVENGLMLGPFSDSQYSETSLSLQHRDKIVLITDGVMEARNSSDQEFGMKSLREIVDAHHSLPLNRLADAVLEGLSDWSEDAIGAGQSDDITLLAMDFHLAA